MARKLFPSTGQDNVGESGPVAAQLFDESTLAFPELMCFGPDAALHTEMYAEVAFDVQCVCRQVRQPVAEHCRTSNELDASIPTTDW